MNKREGDGSMTQTNTITINPLPSKTWNWL